MSHQKQKSPTAFFLSYLWIAIGASLAALSVKLFLFPNQLIDGGIVGLAMILSSITKQSLFPVYFIVLTLPFLYLSYRFIRRTFFIQMIIAVAFFALSLIVLERFCGSFQSDSLEVIVVGGAILGIGSGLIIRNGACLDGTEILAIIVNRKKGFTVGQVVLFINVFIFGAYALIFKNWHIALHSLLTYVVAFKMMDIVIVGLDEIKSVMIISSNPQKLKKIVMHEMGLGLTVMHGRGGYTNEAHDILFIIVERLDLADLKEIILREDPAAFIAVENLHEVVYGKESTPLQKKRTHKKRRPKVL